MMGLASDGRQNREGTRMGLWGAAQAVAFGLGSFLGTVGVDAARAMSASTATAYGSVFLLEGLLFLLSAWLAAHLSLSSLEKLRRHDAYPGRHDLGRHDLGPRPQVIDAVTASPRPVPTPQFAGE